MSNAELAKASIEVDRIKVVASAAPVYISAFTSAFNALAEYGKAMQPSRPTPPPPPGQA